MRRILMLNNEFPPLGGGQGVFNELLLSFIAAKRPDITVDLITASRSSSEYSREQFAERITIHRVPVDNKDIHHSRGIELLRYALRSARLASHLTKSARYDLSLAFSAVPAGLVARILKARFRIPYVTRSPGVDIPGFEARYRFLYPILAPLIRNVWNGASRNIVSSQLHAELMRIIDARADPLTIPNDVDAETFRPCAAAKIGSRKFVVLLCVARLVKRKAVHHLLSAVKALVTKGAAVRLLIVGTGDDEETLKTYASTLGLAEYVEFKGAIPRAEMPALYRRADLFVLPSANEGMSNAALEALASGLPLVLSNVGGTSELVERGVNGFAPAVRNQNELTAEVSALVDSGALRATMGAASRRRSSAFSFDAIAIRYLEVLLPSSISHENHATPRD